MFVTGTGINSVSLSAILVDVAEHKVNDIETDGSLEDSWESDGLDDFVGFFKIPYGNCWSGCHF